MTDLMTPLDQSRVTEAFELVDVGGTNVHIRDGHSGMWGADTLATKLESEDHAVEWEKNNIRIDVHPDFESGTESVSMRKDNGEQHGWDGWIVSPDNNVNSIFVGHTVDGCNIRFGLTSNKDDNQDFENGYYIALNGDKRAEKGCFGKTESIGKYELNENFKLKIENGGVCIYRNAESKAFEVAGDTELSSMYAKVFMYERDDIGRLEGKTGVSQVTSIDMNGNLLSDAGVDRLATALEKQYCKVVDIDLGTNRIKDEGAITIARVLEGSYCKIRTLALSHNEIEDKGVAALAEAISKESCNVTKLWLNDNGIGDLGANSLAALLEKEFCQLDLLELSWNRIGDEGGQRLCQAISNPECKLTSFSLDHNKILDKRTKKMLGKVLASEPRFIDMT